MPLSNNSIEKYKDIKPVCDVNIQIELFINYWKTLKDFFVEDKDYTKAKIR